MRRRTAEVYGLFVDDGSFALAIVVWLFMVFYVSRHFAFPAYVRAPVLGAGLLLILLESVVRRAAR
jgi:hypothetical protein